MFEKMKNVELENEVLKINFYKKKKASKEYELREKIKKLKEKI